MSDGHQRCRLYRADPALVITALTGAEILARYCAWVQDDAQSQAESSQHAMATKMLRVAARLGTEGFDQVAARDRAALDALLTDVFAVATWHGWSLPITDAGTIDIAADDPAWQRGLLRAERNPHGAVLYRRDDRLALRRDRDAQDVDVREWHQGGPPPTAQGL